MAYDPLPNVLPHTHTPLANAKGQFRLIKLEQSSDDHVPVCCEIQVFDIDTSPPYSALSYTWDLPPPTRTIFINSKPFEIRENLSHFLQEYRKKQNHTVSYL
jgi:hypothetical protein